MKTRFLPLAIFFLLVGLTSCKKVVTALLPGIDVRIPAVTFTFPAVIIAPAGEVSLGSHTTQFNMDSIVRANTGGVFNADDISSVKVKSITLTVQNSDNLNNLSNFEYARLTLSSNTNNQEAEVVRIDFPDAQLSTITATPASSPDLRNYLSGNQLQYQVYGKVRRITTKPLNLQVAVTVRID